jgi:hypothetical protein
VPLPWSGSWLRSLIEGGKQPDTPVGGKLTEVLAGQVGLPGVPVRGPASWYSDWLVDLFELPALLGTKPVRSELTYLLVGLDKDYRASQPGEPGEPTMPSGSSPISVPPDAEPPHWKPLKSFRATPGQ